MGREVLAFRHGSLFSGIGGFDLAAEWMGWNNIFYCEKDPFCLSILQYYFPKAVRHEDIRRTNFKSYRGTIDILTGGFPCQPYSIAGKRLGKQDPRHLWPEMLRAVREIQPGWVVAENVRGLINWDGGLVFHEVQLGLEAEGYDVLPFLLPAAGINAPHKRERVWFIAYRGGGGRPQDRGTDHRQTENPTIGEELLSQSERSSEVQSASGANIIGEWGADSGNFSKTSAHPSGLGCHDRSDHRQGRSVQTDQRTTTEDEQEWQERQRGTGAVNQDPFGTKGSNKGYTGNLRYTQPTTWQNFPETEPSIRCGNDGLPGELDFAALFDISFSKWRTESIKGLGNAIVPQVAMMIFKTIQAVHLQLEQC